METTASLRRKITGANDLQAVVRTMKAVAASSISEYENSVRALADYYHTVELGLSACFRQHQTKTRQQTLAPPQAPKILGAVIFGSDQGLVGQFNDVIADFAIDTLTRLTSASPSEKPMILAVGERVQARLIDAGLSVERGFAVPGSVKAIAPLLGQVLRATEKNHQRDEVTELRLFYNRPTSGPVYAPVTQRLLPLDAKWRNQLIAMPWPTSNLPEVLGHQPLETLRALVRDYLFVSLFRACAESLSSENASRLAAMQRADKNIDELLTDLNSKFHRLRQGNIDAEMFDVIAGANQ